MRKSSSEATGMTRSDAIISIIFAILQLLCISEQLAGGPYLNFCTAYHFTMILRDQVNIRPMSTAEGLLSQFQFEPN
jgi:hypothetical protein